MNALTSSKQRRLRLLKNMIAVHGIDKVFGYCTYRSEKESRRYYSVTTGEFGSIKKKLKLPLKRVSRVSLTQLKVSQP